MPTLKRSLSLPDPARPDLQLRRCTGDFACDVAVMPASEPARVRNAGRTRTMRP